ncbi:MAG: hypothetical protein ACOY0T_37725 [Myxococcota bacterium]
MSKWKWIMPLVALPLFGCAGSLASVSAGHVGCAPSQIEISDEVMGFSSTSWTATCGERVYTCSGAQNQVACTPLGGEQPKPAAAPPAPSLAQSPAPARTHWVKQAIEQCGVEAEFPGKPKVSAEETKTKSGAFMTYTATAAVENEWEVALTCARIGALKSAKRPSGPKLLDAMRDSVVKSVAGELVSEREVIGGREIDFSVDGQISRARLLVLDDRVVTATVSPLSALTTARLAQFFRSVETRP